MSAFLEDHSSALGHWVKGDPEPFGEATITNNWTVVESCCHHHVVQTHITIIFTIIIATI